MENASGVRIGFIGAGSIARSRHLPGLAAIPGVKVVAVANRSHESAEAVARDWNIPHIVDNWEELLRRPDIDAIFIGTWPYMHAPMSIAALNAGKHVFCQARMTMDLVQAKAMLAAARAHPNLVAHICPPPTRMPFEPYVKHLIESGGLGQIVAVELLSASGSNLKLNSVHWREQVEFSGKQTLAMGIYAETLNAWVGPYQELSAFTATPIPTKRDSTGQSVTIRIPQVVTVTGRLTNGALAVERHFGLAADKSTPDDRLTIWGRKGTLRYDFGDTIHFASAGQELAPVTVPANLKRDWRVESDFIEAVRGAMAGKSHRVGINPDFAEGLEYMRKVEAVHLSATTGKAVKLSEL